MIKPLPDRFVITTSFILMAGIASMFAIREIYKPQITQQKAATASLPAFPGAEGFGAQSTGGRGGRVIEVTNLNDSGAGSLRACVEAAGPRICVFRVAGTITLNTGLKITNGNITIAGQTAPGGGITLKNASTNGSEVIRIGNNSQGINPQHVIIRFIRTRPGPGAPGSCCLDGIRILGGSHIIIDHVSSSWGVDQAMSTWYAQSDITISWSILSEALDNSNHQEGPHSKGFLAGDHAKRITLHHNLLAHNVDRNMLWKGDTSGEFINNVVYNWSKQSPKNGSTHLNDSDGSGPSLVNIIGNHYIPGPNTPTGYKAITIGSADLTQDTHTNTKVYVAGNIGPGRLTDTGDEWLAVDDYGSTTDLTSPHRTNSFAIPPSGVTVTAVSQVKNAVLLNAGSHMGLDANGLWLPRRDSVDTRIVSEVTNGTGKIINNPSEVGGWPQLQAGTAYPDTDHDGMSDMWEQMHFGNLTRGSGADSSSDFDTDGYTDLEEFLNGSNPKAVSNPTVTGQPTGIPTTSPSQGTTKLSVTLFLHGIGRGGDNVNPSSIGTSSPLHQERPIRLELYNSTNQLIKVVQGTVVFNSTAGNFTGILDAGNIPAGPYTAKVLMPQYLHKAAPGIITLAANLSPFTLPSLSLTTGDMNNDNRLSILDYNLLLDCFSDLSPARNCADPAKKLSTDLTDDGNVNQFDYNLFLRELSVQSGQ